jgi:CRP-like cAMP-binding protein
LATRSKDLGTLSKVGWLPGQPESLSAWAARAGRWRVYEKGRTLYQYGDDPDGLYGLGSGMLEAQIPMGEEQITIYRAEPGFWIGESALLARTSRVISVSAAVKSRVFFIPTSAIKALLRDEPQFWYCFFELNHLNAARAVAALAELLSQSPQERLARMLLRLADAEGKVSATQEDLSRLIGMSRSSLRRVLGDLMDTGAVEAGYRSLRLVDRQGLVNLINRS